MSLERLIARGEVVGDDAVERVRNKLISRAILLTGVDIVPSHEGIVLSGKRLRRRVITDPNLRNFAR